MNSAFVGYEELSRSRRVLTSSICLILHILRKPNSLIAKYVNRMKKFKYGEVVGTMKNNLNKVNRIAASEAQ